jgi:hypothetical protein
VCEKKQFFYFNHIIESEIALPELIKLTDKDSQNKGVDVSFRVSNEQGEMSKTKDWLHHWVAPDESVSISFARDKDTLYLHFPGLARFAIRNNGGNVTCYTGSSLTSATIRHLLLDQVLPRVYAHYYPYMVYHASFLSVNGRGICFLADSGWGKSTIAAAVGAAGNTILNDDCMGIIVQDQKSFGVAPYCGIRLLSDSIDHFGEYLLNPGDAVGEYTSKRRIRLEPLSAEAQKECQLQAFFLLSSPEEGYRCGEVQVKPVGGMQAMKALLKNTFCLDVHDGKWQKDHFRQVSALVASGLPIYSLSYPRDYTLLPEVVKAIMDTLEQR